MMSLSVKLKRPRSLYMAGESVDGELIFSGKATADNDDTATEKELAAMQAIVVNLMGVAQSAFWKRETDKTSSPSGKLLQKGKEVFLYRQTTLLGNLHETGPRPVSPGYQRVVLQCPSEEKEAASARGARLKEGTKCEGLGEIIVRRKSLEQYNTWRLEVYFEEKRMEDDKAREMLAQGVKVGEVLLDDSHFIIGSQALTVNTTKVDDAEVEFKNNYSVEATSICFAVDESTNETNDDGDDGPSLILRIHAVDFAAPVRTFGQVYLRLCPKFDGNNESSSNSIQCCLPTQSSSPLPLKLAFSFRLPKQCPDSFKWSQGKRYNASIRYWLGGYVLFSEQQPIIAVQEPLYVLFRPKTHTSPQPNLPIIVQVRKQALTYSSTSWIGFGKEIGQVDLKLCLSKRVLVPGQEVELTGTSVTNHTAKIVEICIQLNQHVHLTALDGDVIMRHGWNEKYPFTWGRLRAPFRTTCPPGETWTMPPERHLVVPRVQSTFESSTREWPVQLKYTCQLYVSISDTTASDIAHVSTEAPVVVSPLSDPASDEQKQEQKDSSSPTVESTDDTVDGGRAALSIQENECTNILWKVEIAGSRFDYVPGVGTLSLCC